MPKLDGKKYPYTKAGKEQHKKDKAKKSGLTAKQKGAKITFTIKESTYSN